MAKRKSINVNGILGGVFALAIIGAVGYIVLRRDEILTGLDNRFNFSGGSAPVGAVETSPLDTSQNVDNIDNNNNDSSSPNTSNQNTGQTLSPRKASQHNRNAQIYQRLQQNQNQNLVYHGKPASEKIPGYELARKTSNGLTQNQVINQYLANRQGYDLAATFQSESKPLPRGNRDYTGAVPPALRHLFPKSVSNRKSTPTPAPRSTPTPTPKPAKRNLYAGLTGGHSGFRGARRT